MDRIEPELRFPASNCASAAAALRRHGLVIIDDLWSADRIAVYQAALKQTYPEIFGGDLACQDILLHPTLESLLQQPLDEDYVFESIGVILSHPGALQQHRHRDSAQLFPAGERPWNAI